jgi:hypothetical protein
MLQNYYCTQSCNTGCMGRRIHDSAGIVSESLRRLPGWSKFLVVEDAVELREAYSTQETAERTGIFVSGFQRVQIQRPWTEMVSVHHVSTYMCSVIAGRASLLRSPWSYAAECGLDSVHAEETQRNREGCSAQLAATTSGAAPGARVRRCSAARCSAPLNSTVLYSTVCTAPPLARSTGTVGQTEWAWLE